MKKSDLWLLLVVALVVAVSFVALHRMPITPVEPRKSPMEKVSPAPVKDLGPKVPKKVLGNPNEPSVSVANKGKGYTEVRTRLSVSIE
jgi:hypothetical protein